MNKIKTFEQFSANEMFMTGIPVNPKTGTTVDLLGSIDIMKKEIAKLFGGNVKQVTEKLDKAIEQLLSKVDGEKLLDAVEDYFGMPANKLTYSLVKSKLEKTNELHHYDDVDPFITKQGKTEYMGEPSKNVSGGLAQKVLSLLGNIFAINMMSIGAFGTLATWLIDKCVDIGGTVNPALSFVYSLVAFMVVCIVRKVVAMFDPNAPKRG